MDVPVQVGAGESDALVLADRLAAQRFDGLSGRVIELDDPDTVWIVLSGRVDVQAVAMRGGRVDGIGRHLFEAGPGHLLPGTTPAPAPSTAGGLLTLRGRCGAGTVLYRTDRPSLRELSLDLEALVAIERWVESLLAAITPEVRALSTDLVEADPGLAFAAGTVLCAPHGAVVWVQLVSGSALPLGEAALRLRAGAPAWPLTEQSWVAVDEPAVLDGFLTPARMVTGEVWEDLDAFGRAALLRVGAEIEAAAAERVVARDRRAAWTRTQFDGGLLRLGQAADPDLRGTEAPLAPEDGWAAAFAAVASASGISVPESTPGRSTDIEEATLAAGVAFRQVKLLGRWWLEDHGPLLGFRSGTGDEARAVALLPDGPTRYRAEEGGTGPGRVVDAALAAELEPLAIMLYRPLPPRVNGLFALLRFGAYGLRRDLGTVLVMGGLVGLLGMLVPVASGFLLQSVLPRADLPMHLAVIGGLAATALGNAAFTVVEAIAMARVQARIDLSAEAGVWNRLLRLRAGFFRGQATGDLADRANGVSEIRRTITGSVTQSLLSGVFALSSGALLFVYDARLALIAMGFTLAVVLLETVLFAIELPRRRLVARARGRSDSLTFEILSAMAKLRAAAAEPRAFARWSAGYAEYSGHRRAAGAVDVGRAVLTSVVPLFGTALVFAGAVGVFGGGDAALSFGAFVAFQAAFGNFIGGIMSIVTAGEALVGVAPIWERLRPILSAEQETGTGSIPVGTVRGAVSLSHVSFGYDEAAAPVLDKVSLSIRSGEYVALVGPSGSGKSTVIRLILGLEQPQSGAVYIDGMDLATIDLAAMRRQFGVVMQAGQLVAGSIMENILGSAPLPEARAWEAARQAGVEADIRAMPMGLHTVLSEGGSGLSGGQKQRLLIARALVRRPRLLLFDEATSALDNATQAEVKASLDRLNVTRIVVAHRLSTIRDVHRIIVMEAGKVVEEGSFDELIARGGLFSRLAARQVA